MARHNNTAQSARSVIARLVFKKPLALEIQHELVDVGKNLSKTLAGIKVNKELVWATARQKQILQETKVRLERERAKNEVGWARELDQQRRDGKRILRQQEQARTRLEAERQKERRRLEAIAAEAERNAQEAREQREQIRISLQHQLESKQQASFGIILSTPYEHSNSLHGQRTTSISGEEKVVDGYWGQIVPKGNWSSVPASYSVCRTYSEYYPQLHIVQDIYMYTGNVSNPAFAQTPDGVLYSGFSKIGTISADMSHLQSSISTAGGYLWKLSYDIRLSIQYHQLSAWMEWQFQGVTQTSPKTVFDISL